ncbi:MAG: glycosyltransferase family 2 protein, partial [Candidatus Tectomicrobia bacterium]|nr:glycosyltransferase family 2 protein [Candidatus Tectomicrobia bacterium]
SEMNLGAAWNYNHVFKLSSGTYFKWAAADDLFTPDYLETCVAVLDTQPEVILCYPKTIIIDEHGHQLGPYDDNLDLRYPSVRKRFRQAITRMQECNAVFGVIRSDVLRRTSLIGNYLASDNVLLTELALMGQFCEFPKYLFFRRQHKHASSSQTQEGIQEFFDPKTRGSLCLQNWKHLAQYIVTVKRAPLNPLEKIQLAYIVWRSAITRRHRLAQESLLAGRQLLCRWLTP